MEMEDGVEGRVDQCVMCMSVIRYSTWMPVVHPEPIPRPFNLSGKQPGREVKAWATEPPLQRGKLRHLRAVFPSSHHPSMISQDPISGQPSTSSPPTHRQEKKKVWSRGCRSHQANTGVFREAGQIIHKPTEVFYLACHQQQPSAER